MSIDSKGRRYPGPLAGFRVGVLCLDTVHPLVPGNVQHAGSFNFPVLYETVKNVSLTELMSGHENAVPPILEAAHRLERSGVSIIVGACGSFANFQKPVTESVGVPAFMSILTQVPFLLGALPSAQKLGIIFASTASYTAKVREQCGISGTDRIVAIGANSLPAFAPIMAQQTELDSDALKAQIAQLADETLQQHPEIGAWMLQCSDLPPYAAAIQRATGLAVFDMATLLEHVQRAATRTEWREG